MLSKIFLALAIACATNVALAGTGAAKIRYTNGSGTGDFDVTRSGDTVRGQIFALGNMYGSVELVKVNGLWKGHMGLLQINSTSIDRESSNKSRIEISTLPGGFHQFHTETKPNKLEINAVLSNGEMIQGRYDFEKNEVDAWNDFIGQNIRSKHADGIYEGPTMIRDLNGQYDNVSTTLTSSGDLMPSELAKNDHNLYLLLYLLPINYFR